MRKLFISICFLLLAISLMIPGCKKKEDVSGKEQKPEVKVSSEETDKTSEEKVGESSSEKTKQTSEEKYEEVNPAELSFEMKNYNYMGVVAAGGGIEPSDGHIGEFLCEGKPLALSSEKFQDGFVLTKDYGKIKIVFGASLYRESFAVFLTPKQKKALGSLKKKKEEQSSSDGEYKPVHYSEIVLAFKNYDYPKVMVDADGLITPDGGKIGEVHCALGNGSGQATSSKKIDLLSDKFENGYVHTKQFGKIKVIFRKSDGQYIIFMTDKQKSEIIKYLSQ